MLNVILSTVIGFVFGALVVYLLWYIEGSKEDDFLCDLYEYLAPKKSGTAQKAARMIDDFLDSKGK